MFQDNIWAGQATGFKAALFVDNVANTQQQEALQTIFSGQAGGDPGMTTILPGWFYRRPRAPCRQTPGEPDHRVVGSGLCRRPDADCSDARPAARSLHSGRHSKRTA